MAITNASRLADWGAGIGTAGAVIQVDNANDQVGIGTTNPQAMLQIGTGVTVYGNSGIVSATTYYGSGANLTGTATTNNIITGTAATFTSEVDFNYPIDINKGVNITGVTTGLNVSGVGTVGTAVITSATVGSNVIINSTGITGSGQIATFTTFDGNLSGNITGNCTVSGNLTVQGTTTTIDSETLIVEDKNIGIGSTSNASDTTADGGGITIFGSTDGSNDKTFTWERDTGCFEVNNPFKFKGVTETVATASTSYVTGSTDRLTLTLDAAAATVYTHSQQHGNVGIISITNVPTDTGKPNGTTVTLLYTQNSAGAANTTIALGGIGTVMTITGFENGSAVTSIATTALAGSGTTVLASDVAGDVDFISFFVEFKGDSNTDQGSYKVYATKNGGFRYP